MLLCLKYRNYNTLAQSLSGLRCYQDFDRDLPLYAILDYVSSAADADKLVPGIDLSSESILDTSYLLRNSVPAAGCSDIGTYLTFLTVEYECADGTVKTLIEIIRSGTACGRHQLDHQLLQAARDMLEEARDSTDTAGDDATSGDATSVDVTMQDAAAGGNGTSDGPSIQEASSDVNRLQALKDAIAEMTAMGCGNDDQSDGANESDVNSSSSGAASGGNSIGARQKGHQSCHKQTTTASLVSARYCIFPSIDNIEPHLKKAALKIIARLVNLPEDAEIISVKIEDRAVIRFTEEGLLNAAGVFARGSSASTDDDYSALVRSRSRLGYGLERNKSLGMSQSAQMTKTNNSFERDRWGLVITDSSEAMLEELKTRLNNWDDLDLGKKKTWYRRSLSLLVKVIDDLEAKDVDAVVVQEYQLRRSQLRTLTDVCSIRSIEHARVFLDNKDVIGVLQRRQRREGLKHNLQNWDALDVTSKWRYRRTLKLLTDVIDDLEASDVDAAVVQEHQLRRSKLPRYGDAFLIRSIEDARTILENKNVIEWAARKAEADERKAKLKAEEVAPALHQTVEAMVEEYVTASKTVSEEAAMAQILPLAQMRLSALEVHAYTVPQLQTVIQGHLRHKIPVRDTVKAFANAFASKRSPRMLLLKQSKAL